VDNESRKNIGPETELEVISKMEAEMAKADIIVVSDYNKGLLTKQVISRLLERAKKSGKKIIVDTKRSMMDYKGVDYIVPNFKELCIAFATKPTNEDGFILPHTEELSKKLGCTVIVKRSGKGATIADKAGTRTYPTAATDIINVSGAGDIFVAILSLALASGKTIDEAVKLANAGCAKAITRRHPSVSPGDF
jgi:D-beta-D-heptose 7-phosphate kinase/D-beta-D-heptose 1-phosphate adenosyltransferase